MRALCSSLLSLQSPQIPAVPSAARGQEILLKPLPAVVRNIFSRHRVYRGQSCRVFFAGAFGFRLEPTMHGDLSHWAAMMNPHTAAAYRASKGVGAAASNPGAAATVVEANGTGNTTFKRKLSGTAAMSTCVDAPSPRTR